MTSLPAGNVLRNLVLVMEGFKVQMFGGSECLLPRGQGFVHLVFRLPLCASTVGPSKLAVPWCDVLARELCLEPVLG